MKKCSQEIKQQQHKTTKPININIEHFVMAKNPFPVRNNTKLSPRFTGPYKIIETTGGNKFQIQRVHTDEVHVRQLDDLKRTIMALE